jgi:nitrogen fixation/metabolism regulation signal transduction histidine kinase
VLRRDLLIQEIPGLEVTAVVSRGPLLQALGKMDRSIALAGAIAVLLSIALAVLVASSLSRPIVELARETRVVVRGKPRPVRARGGRELSELARSFNRTLDELGAMRRRLAVSERIAARREIARHIAHEIKNPLAPIRAAVETLRRLRERGSPEFDGYFEEATATVLTEVHRIATIVSEFTKFARLPAPKFERVDLEAVARSVVGLHDGKGITGAPRVVLEAEPVPEIQADRDQLVQVLQNLVQNGIEAARGQTDPPIMPRVRVTIRRDSEHTVCLGVRDNGPGVDAAIRERLFEPYASTKVGGTGLGLAIAQRIAFEHGGEIRCAEPDGEGALFEVLLPIDGPPLTEAAPTPAAGPRG